MYEIDNPNSQSEIWKKTKNGNDYLLSNKGQIKSLSRWTKSGKGHRRIKERILKPIKDQDGYLVCSMRVGEKRRVVRIHRLIAETFIPNPDNKPVVNHKNAIKNDNRVENLEWCTVQENSQHAKLNNLYSQGENHHKAKLTESQVKKIIDKLGSGVGISYITKEYDIGRDAVVAILDSVSWKNVKRQEGVDYRKIRRNRQPAPRGENHARAKLNDFKVNIIREMLDHKIPVTIICNVFKVSESLIKQIRTRKLWNHL